MKADTSAANRYGGGANSLHHLAASMLTDARLVLDVGCGRGYLAQVLPAEVDGIELDAERAEEARGRCRRVHDLSADDPELPERLGGPYDALVFIDALEHFPDPSVVLRNLLPTLAPGAAVVAIIPNVAHFSHRLTLLHGRWDYADEGILDRTHLRFYTWSTSAELLWEAGLEIVSHSAVLAVPRVLRWMPESIPQRWPNLFGVHTVLLARSEEGSG